MIIKRYHTNNMRKVLISLSLLSLMGCQTIRGVVRDRDTQTPVASAIVTNTNSKTTAMTDALGAYNLFGVASVGDTIMVNAPGYNIYTTTVTQVTQPEIKDMELTKSNSF